MKKNNVLDERQTHEMYKRHYILSEVIYWLMIIVFIIEALFLRLSWKHWIVEFALIIIMSAVKTVSYVKSGIWLSWRQTPRTKDCIIGALAAASIYLLLILIVGLVRNGSHTQLSVSWQQYSARFVIVFSITFAVLFLIRHKILHKQNTDEDEDDD